jgi:hypothetical protein
LKIRHDLLQSFDATITINNSVEIGRNVAKEFDKCNRIWRSSHLKSDVFLNNNIYYNQSR